MCFLEFIICFLKLLNLFYVLVMNFVANFSCSFFRSSSTIFIIRIITKQPIFPKSVYKIWIFN